MRRPAVIAAFVVLSCLRLDAGETAYSASDAAASGIFPAMRARVTARRHTILSSQTSGRIEELNVRDGDRFQEGQVLARLDAAMAESQLDRSRAAYHRQEMIYRMNRELVELQTKGEIEAEVARAEMEQAQADMRAAEKMMARAVVTAPFSGRVAEVFAREKQYVSEGQPLLEILDDSTLELEFIVPSGWIRWFTPGFQFAVRIEETGHEYQARLERIGGKVDPLSQSAKAYAVFLNPSAELMEGMSGEARITAPGAAQ